MKEKKTVNKSSLSLIEQQLGKYYNISLKDATNNQIYNALAHIVIDKTFEKRRKFSKLCKAKDAKAVNYLCMEFLIGKTLRSSLFNLGLKEGVEKALKLKHKNIEEVYKIEDDAGLGNGGLGRSP